MKRTLADIRENLDFVGCDNETAREMCDEIERLRAFVDWLPTTADGMPVVPGSCVWIASADQLLCWNFYAHEFAGHKRSWFVSTPRGGFALDECYSTKESAEKARKE